MKVFCPLCQHQQELLVELKIKEVMFRIDQVEYSYLCCSRCESIYLTSVLNSHELEEAYSSSYYSQAHDPEQMVALGNGKVIGRVIRIVLALPTSIYRAGYRFLPNSKVRNLLRMVYAVGRAFRKELGEVVQPRKSLDVGTGSGFLPTLLSRRLNQEWVGIDPYLRKELNSARLELHRQSLKQHAAQKQERSYDLICFNHSLEHVDDPEGDLGAAHKLLSDSGRLLIRVPNAQSTAFQKFGQNWFQIDAPRHCFVPTLKGMTLLAARCDLKVIDAWCDSSSAQFWMSRRVSKGEAMTIKGQSGEYSFASQRLLDQRRLDDYFRTALANKNLRGDQICIVLARQQIK